MNSGVVAVMIKEFLAVLRDSRSRSVLILPPLIQLILFSYAVTLEVKNVSIAIYNQDIGKRGDELIHRVKGSPTFNHVEYLSKESDIKPILDQQKALVVLQFPADFSRKIEEGEQGELQVLLDGRRTNSASIVLGYLTDIVENYNQELSEWSPKLKKPAVLVPRNWFNPNLNYKWFTVPSLVALLSMVIALVLTSLSVAREREMGTFEQLLVSPLTPRQILVGKTIPAVLLALVEGSVILGCSIFIFGIKFEGSFFLLYCSLIVFLFSIVGIGLFISSLCTTQQQTIVGTFLFMTPSVNLAGFVTPAENMPLWLQYASEVIPFKHFLIVIKGIYLKDISAQMVFDNTWPNIVIAIFTLSAAGWLFRRRME